MTLDPRKLSAAMMPFLHQWGMEGGKLHTSTTRGEPDSYMTDPRFAVHQYTGPRELLTFALHLGDGRWIESTFTPDQAVAAVASILSKPAMAPVIGPLLDALKTLEPQR